MSVDFIRCEPCNKGFSGPEPYVEHLKSKTHQKIELATSKKINPYAPATPNKSAKIYCEGCDVYISGPEPYKQHLSGNKHTSMLKKKLIMPKIEASTEINTLDGKSGVDSGFSCKICSKSFSGPECVAQHLKSKKHIRKVELDDMKNRHSSIPTCPGLDIYPKLPKDDNNMTRGEYATKNEEKSEKKVSCFSGFSKFFKKEKKGEAKKQKGKN